MHIRLSAATIAAVLAGASTAFAACPPGQTRNCVNFDNVPQISQQIVAQEPPAPGSRLLPRVESDKPYTGPTVGIAPGVRRGPTVGYKWSLQ